MMDEFSKPSKKGSILAVACYVFAVALLITAFVSLAACHQNISRQLEQGVPVQGNELAIVNLYLTSCVQYFAFAAAMVFCGKASRAKRRYRSRPICSIPRQRPLAPPLRKRWSRRRTMKIGKAGNFGSKTSKSGVLMQQHEGQTEFRS